MPERSFDISAEMLEAEIAKLPDKDRVLWLRFRAGAKVVEVTDSWAFFSNDPLGVIVEVWACSDTCDDWLVGIRTTLTIGMPAKTAAFAGYRSHRKHSLRAVAKAMIYGIKKYFSTQEVAR